MCSPEKIVHIWFYDMDNRFFEESAFDMLPRKERLRAMRLRDPVEATRCLRHSVLLHETLAGVMHCSPFDICFGKEKHGRPVVSCRNRGSEGIRPLNFSVSRSSFLMGVAVAFSYGIGLDVELVDPLVGDERFFISWTRHEAIGKLSGTGIAYRHVESLRKPSFFLTRSMNMNKSRFVFSAAVG